MKPNVVGGVTFVNEEVPVVLHALRQEGTGMAQAAGERFVSDLTESPAQEPGVPIIMLELPEVTEAREDIARAVREKDPDAPERQFRLPLTHELAQTALDSIQSAYSNRHLLRRQRPIAREMLIEADRVERPRIEKIALAASRLARRGWWGPSDTTAHHI